MSPTSERIKSIGVITLGVYAFGAVIGLNAFDLVRIFDVEPGWPWWAYALAPIPLGILFFWRSNTPSGPSGRNVVMGRSPSNRRLLSDAFASALLRRALFSAPKPGR